MKLGIICGSGRGDSQSAKVGSYIATQLQQKGHETWLCDLGGKDALPLWDDSIFAGSEEWKTRLAPVAEQLTSCEGFVIISPEWHGMVPSALKNFFLFWGKGELAHKAATIVAVSSGTGGAYPVAELRMSSYKNNRIAYTPEHVIVRGVENVLNAAEPESEDDQRIRTRLNYALDILLAYTGALNTVRASGVVDLKAFGNGM